MNSVEVTDLGCMVLDIDVALFLCVNIQRSIETEGKQVPDLIDLWLCAICILNIVKEVGLSSHVK